MVKLNIKKICQFVHYYNIFNLNKFAVGQMSISEFYANFVKKA